MPSRSKPSLHYASSPSSVGRSGTVAGASLVSVVDCWGGKPLIVSPRRVRGAISQTGASRAAHGDGCRSRWRRGRREPAPPEQESGGRGELGWELAGARAAKAGVRCALGAGRRAEDAANAPVLKAICKPHTAVPDEVEEAIDALATA